VIVALTIYDRERILRALEAPRTEVLAELRAALLQEHVWRVDHGLVKTPRGHKYRGRLVAIDDVQFQSLLEQVRELHQRADEITRSSTQIRANVRARLNWERNPPTLPPEQTKLADEVVEILAKPRLSSSQSRQLQRAFYGR
jgi:hypothetical protein